MQDKNELFASAPIPRAVATMAIPTVLSMLVTVVYNMVDTFFVGQTGDANQVAAVSLATPVFLIIMAMGNIFGMGGSAAISRFLGMGERERVKNTSSFCFYGSLAVGVVLVIALLAGMPLVLTLIGTSANTVDFARQYLFVIALGAPLTLTGGALTNLVRAEGAAREAMFGMMLGTVVNIVLDPLMILTFGWGVAGAAIATVIGNASTLVYYLLYFTRRKSILSIAPKAFALRGVWGTVLSIGLPASVNTLLLSLANIILNNFLSSYGDAAVAAMGVAMKANMLVVFVQIGLALGAQPLIGYNFGAKNFARMKAIMKFTMLCTVTLGLSLTALYFIATKPIIRAFIADETVVTYGVHMLRALMLSGPFLGVLFVFMNALQAMGQAIASLVLSISRQGLLFLPLLIVLNAVLQLDGIVYAQPIADVCSIALACALFVHSERRLRRAHESERDAPATKPVAQS